MNYVTLSCLADFDNKFIHIYKKSALNCFVGLEIQVDTFRKAKIIVTNEQILEIENTLDLISLRPEHKSFPFSEGILDENNVKIN